MEQMNPSQIKKHLRQLAERRDQYLYYLGQLAYKAGDAGQLQDPEMLDAYNTLRDIQAQVAQWENSLAQMKAAREAAKQPRCPYCGSPVMKGAVFCAACGRSLVPTQQPGMPVAPMAGPVPQPGAACPNCGAPVDGDTVFCGNCGARVDVGPEPAAGGQPGQSQGEAATTCPGCGAVSVDVYFCPECGTKIKE